MEKPLLHRVLRTANLKAQRGARSSIERVDIGADKEHNKMGNDGAPGPPGDVARTASKAPLRIAD